MGGGGVDGGLEILILMMMIIEIGVEIEKGNGLKYHIIALV